LAVINIHYLLLSNLFLPNQIGVGNPVLKICKERA
jgi:hypothetical protein